MTQPEFTTGASKALSGALALANKQQHGYVDGCHLAYALFEDDNALPARLLRRIGGGETMLLQLQELLSKIPKQTPAPAKPPFSTEMVNIFNEAGKQQKELGDALVAVDHLLLALHVNSPVSRLLNACGATKQNLKTTLLEIRKGRHITSDFQDENYEVLKKYATDMCLNADEGKLDPVIGRSDEIERTIRILSRRTKNNPVLIGEPGVGKTAIVEGIAQRIVRGEVPDTLNGTRLFSLDMGALIAGAKYQGEFEERLKVVLKEVTESENRIVLFIDEIHLVLGAGKTSGAMDAANLLKPLLARGELRTIGATTLEEYRQYIEKDAAFERRFMPVYVNEPTVEQSINILRGLKDRYEQFHGVQITDRAVVVAAQLASRFITNRFMPDKAIDLIDEACSTVRVALSSRPAVIEALEREKLMLEVEKKALEREKSDPNSSRRLKECLGKIQQVQEKLAPLQEKYEEERRLVESLQQEQGRQQEKEWKLERAERSGDMETASDLKYYVIPELKKRIEEIKAKIDVSKQMVQGTVTDEDIATVVSRWTGIPVSRLTQTERERLLQLGDRLHQRVKGQDDAVQRVADALLRARAGLSRENRPVGSFLFLGSTGVGKTELAKSIAAELFDDEHHMVRLDMSEYGEKHNVARLIGAPPGYVGHEEGGQLTEPVRRRPHTVILLDEVEKAHPSIFNVLLQVLDDGRLTDSHGRTVDFSNTIIIMTSNLGTRHLLDEDEVVHGEAKKTSKGLGASVSGKTGELQRSRVMAEVRAFFRPEFFNRLDDVVIFHRLGDEELSTIVDAMVKELASRLPEGVTLELTPAGKQLILEEGSDAELGARPLRRYIDRNITTAISRMIIGEEIHENDKVIVSAATSGDKKKRFTFTVKH